MLESEFVYKESQKNGNERKNHFLKRQINQPPTNKNK